MNKEKNKKPCKHTERQAVASRGNMDIQIVTVVCLQCGKILFSEQVFT